MGFGRPRRIVLRWLLLLGAVGVTSCPASAQKLAAAPPSHATTHAAVSETAACVVACEGGAAASFCADAGHEVTPTAPNRSSQRKTMRLGLPKPMSSTPV